MSALPECYWCVDGLQADGETPCPCQYTPQLFTAADVAAAVLAEREACAIIADGIMVDMMNAALTGLPEQARLRESMANTAEKIRIHIRARPPIPE